MNMPILTKNLSVLPFIFIAFLLLAPDASSSITRTRTMGDAGVILRDDANYWLFPATIVAGANRVIFELGGNRELVAYSPENYGFDRWAGGIVLLKQKAIGAFWSEATEAQLFPPFSATAVSADKKLDFFFGSKTSFGALGLHVSRASGLQKTTRTPGSEGKTSVTQTRFALGLSDSSVDTRLSYQLSRYAPSGPEIAGHEIGFSARLFRTIAERLTWVPFGQLDIDFENRDEIADDTKGKVWDFSIGSGFNYRIDERNLAVFGISIARTSQSLKTAASESEMSQIDMPFFFGGFESGLLSWLHVRFGFQKALRRIESTSESGEVTNVNTQAQAPYAMTAGIGVNYKRFIVDFSWDADFLKRGPYFLSGADGETFNLVSIAYQFD